MLLNALSQRRQFVRTFCSGIGKTAVIYPAAFLVATGFGTVMLGIIFFARDVHHATPTEIGCLAAAWSLCYIVACLFLRPLSQRMWPRYSMLLATVLMLASAIGTLCAPSLGFVFAAHGLLGLSASLFWPPMMGWLSTNIEGDELSQAMGKFNLCWSGGAILSPWLAGSLSEMDSRFPLIASALLYLMTSFLIIGAIMTLTRLEHDDGAHEEERVSGGAEAGGTFLRFPAWCGVWAAFFAQGAILNVFPISAQADLGLAKSTVGLVLCGRALSSAVGLGFMGRTRFWHFRPGQMVSGLIVFGLTAAALAAARSVPCIALLLLVVGALTAQSYANSLFHGVSGSVRRASRMAIHEALLAAGLVGGAALGGATYQRFGMPPVYIGCSVVLLVTTGVQVLLVVQHGRARTT